MSVVISFCDQGGRQPWSRIRASRATAAEKRSGAVSDQSANANAGQKLPQTASPLPSNGSGEAVWGSFWPAFAFALWSAAGVLSAAVEFLSVAFWSAAAALLAGAAFWSVPVVLLAGGF